MKKYLSVILIFSQTCSFAFSSQFIKQQDEYTCGPVSSYNLINELCPNCSDIGVEYFSKLEKTTKKGTTAYDLCAGLEKYFHNSNTSISYYGVKKVKKYKIASEINIDEINKLLSDGHKAILNIGIYTKNNSGEYKRHWGHYVNLISIEADILSIYDPYDKNNDISHWKIKTISGQKINNSNDNEKYIKSVKTYYLIDTPIIYLNPDEYAIINGIIIVR